MEIIKYCYQLREVNVRDKHVLIYLDVFIYKYLVKNLLHIAFYRYTQRTVCWGVFALITVISLLLIILMNSQLVGTPMGTPVSHMLANAVMLE